MTVDSFLVRMFGDKLKSFNESKVLMVGAGGIGCELLKDLILMNIGEIHVLDLDTIDLSNLNRQFLFRQKDIKESKSKTAIKAVEHFSHKSKLVAYHGSVLDNKLFPLSFFKQFDVIYNALDNLEARFYVNRMCLYLNKPLYESGTTGLKGQTQPIYPYLSECFSCVPKETPKTFPVCTIRSTPSKPVHCITWAKDFLFSQLFVDLRNDLAVPEASEFTNEEEAEASLKEVNELADLKRLIMNAGNDDLSYITNIFEKIFIDDIKRLLKIEELWKSRKKPSFDSILDYKKCLETISEDYSEGVENQSDFNQIMSTFITSLIKLTRRLQAGEVLEFDKDDIDTLRFVMSAANLRSLIFHIPTKNEFNTKEIAGNIIPAVATMNAMMAGFSALSSVNYYLYETNEDRVTHCKTVFDSASTDKVINSAKLIKPNPTCSACSVVKGIAHIDLGNTTLKQLRDELVTKYKYSDDIEIMTLDSNLLYDYDFDDNLDKPLSSMLQSESVLLVNDSEDILDIVEIYIIDVPAEIKLPDLEIPLKKVALKSSESEDDDHEYTIQITNNQEETMEVHSLEDDDDLDIIDEPLTKKRRLNEVGFNANV